MMRREQGVITNIIGAAGNADLMALTKELGAESLRHGIRVVAINPGLIHTNRLESQMRRSEEL